MDTPYVFKRCTKCGRWLVASSKYFNKHKNGKYGLASQCKECRAKYKKKWNEENRDARLEYDKIYRKKHRDARLEYSKRYYEEHREARREHDKRYREKHRDARLEYNKKYKEEHRDDCIEYNKRYYEANRETNLERQKEYRNTPQGQAAAFNGRNRRRAKEQNQGGGITKKQWLEMMNFFNWECAYSGEKLTKKTRSIDHIEPLNKGGENEIWNCVPMDRSLNSSKRDKDMLEWYVKQPFYSHERLLKISEWQEYAKNKILKK